MPAVRKETTPIAAVLPAVLQQAQRRYGTLQRVQECWGKLVGKLLAAHTAPVSLRRGRLIVHVDRPGDGFTLNFQRQQLVTQLRARTNGLVEELVIRVGDLSSLTSVERPATMGRARGPAKQAGRRRSP